MDLGAATALCIASAICGFVGGCMVGAVKGKSFCHGVIIGFAAPWRCFRKDN